MSFSDEFLKLRKKKKKTTNTSNNFSEEFLNLRAGKNDEEHIAPVKTTTSETNNKKMEQKGKKRTWFDKGVFDDGRQFGDIAKGILGTRTDVTTHLGAGILGIGEKLVDAGATLGANSAKTHLTRMEQGEIMASGIAKRYGKEYAEGEDIRQNYQTARKQVEEDTAEFVKKDLYDEKAIAKKIISDPVKKITGIDSEEDSFFGEKTDALAQSAGQLGAQIAVSAIPGVGQVGGMAMMGATAFGSEAESALNQGATFDEAMLSATISAGAEMLTEKIGGISFGGKTLTDALASKFSSKLTSKLTTALVSTGKVAVDALAEGGEELLSGYMSAIGQKLTYMADKEIEELFSNEDKLESFIGGVVLGGIGGTAEAVTQGKGYVTGLNKSEQAVVDKIYNDKITKAEQDGKKLTQKEKSKIYDKVMNDLEKGYISTDTIEEVLGGETYEIYKSTIEEENTRKKQLDTLKQEYDGLYKMKNGEKSDEQVDRQAFLRQQIDELTQVNKSRGLKSRLSNEVFSLVKDSKLAESYNEKSRRGQAFEVDLSQYEEKYHATLKKAVESGILNNTNKTHDFVDLIAKISADKNVTFDFTDNQRLKDSGFAIEGKTVNGYITESGDITVNINSAKALNNVVGHEVTHVLEGTELYDILAQSVTEYAKSKGEYDSRLETLTKLYEGVEGTNVEAELVADLVGDYVFTDADFVRKLSVENRNVFQKIYDEIKYLCKVATAGSKEARQLEKVKKTFAEVYRESNAAQKNTAENSGVRYSLNVNAKNELHKALYDMSYRNEVLLRDETPSIMLSQNGVKNRQMVMNASHIRENVFTEEEARNLGLKVDAHTHYHGIGEDYFLKIIDSLDNVKEAYRGTKTASDSSRRENYFLLVTEFKDENGNVINVPVFIDELAQCNRVFIETNKIATVFGREGFRDYINRQVREKNLVRIKNRSNKFSEGDALIAPAYENIAPTDSISNPDEKVNTKKSNDNSNDLAPVKKSLSEQGAEANQYGDYNVSGKDIMLEAPIREDIAKTEMADDIGPVKEAVSKTESAKTDLEKAVADYVESNIEEIESDLNNEVLNREPKNIFAGTRKGFVRRLSNGSYESATFGEGSGIVMNENIIRTDSLEEAISAQYQYMLENSNGDISSTIQKHAKNYDNTHKTVEEDIAPVKESVSETEGVNKVKSNIAPKGRQFSDMDEYFDWLLDEESNTKDTAPVGAENVADSEEAGRVSSHIKADPEKSKGKTSENRVIETVEDRIAAKLETAKTALENNRRLREESAMEFDIEIAQLQKEYQDKKNKNTKVANNILRRIERLQQLKGNVDADYAKRISDLEAQVEKLSSPTYKVAEQRRAKQGEYFNEMEELVGDTTTWKDKKMGLSYMVNTLRRNLRDIVRDKSGKQDIRKADKIYDVLQGSYNKNEATLNREVNRIKKVYADMKITSAEDEYIQMLGELRHNPNTTLTEDEVKAYYQKHKNKIDKAKVDKAISLARNTYDELLIRLNKVLKEQGMKQIPHRKGYFPHFTEEKQGFLGKLFNWKTKNNDIPTDIAGLTENFNPDRSWQSFNKQRTTDDTDYSFLKGMDSYVQGALDWIYHIEDIQKRRAFENYIRYVHSEQGVKDKIEAIRNSEEYDADEAQEQIDLVYKEAANPLNNFVTDFRTATNTLAGKKSSLDRGVETATNRKIYSVMTNISNRVSANMVAGSVSSALTNFIPITQSWAQVSPVSSLKAMGQTLKSIIRNDGTVEKSNFLTNRLKASENLYKTTWDKIIDKAGILMEGVDSFTSQVVWRSKYIENIKKGMSESEAIKNADQFAENVIAGRSRGNLPTAFDAKNSLAKIFTTFQLEVNNQYGYMFKDVPQDLKAETKHWKANLVKGYATMFIGAYAYNALYSALAGRDAAFDPIGIVEDLLRDLGLFGDDEEEEPQEVIMNLADNIIDELPFVGGVLGDGGRIPLSSVLPYDNGVYGAVEGAVNDTAEGNWDSVKSEIGNSFVSYLLAPAGGGQIRKTVQGLSMFNTDEEHPIAGSYTKSGDLRFPVDDTLLNRLKAGIFGQWANENAQDYIENGRKPLNEKQMQEFMDVDLPIADYWKYRDGLKGLDKLSEKGDYIGGLDLPVSKKNILINNIADRKEDIDMTDYNKYPSFEEFDYAQKNPEKYEFLNSQGVSVSEYENFDKDTKEAYSWAAEYPEKFEVSRAVANNVVEYKGYTKALSELKADKDKDGNSISGSRKEKVIDYINDLDIDYGAKIVLYKSQYKSDDTYNSDIVEYLNSRDDISYKQMETILTELGFKVLSDGTVQW